MNNLLTRAVSKYRRTAAKYLFRRMVQVEITTPIIYLSFDDAPHTAFTHGGKILNTYGANATFYMSLGILESDSPSGPIASLDDLRRAVKDGHELGCHTFDHLNPRETKPDLFVQSVLKNHQTLSQILPEAAFTSLAYPLCCPSPAIKRRIGKQFLCCRGGEHTSNVGTADLNYLNAVFFDARNAHTIDTVKQLIDKNAESLGWLIFATHDVDDNPSPYGCSKKFFEEAVAHAANSGSLLLPVGKACEQIQMTGNEIKSAPQS